MCFIVDFQKDEHTASSNGKGSAFGRTRPVLCAKGAQLYHLLFFVIECNQLGNNDGIIVKDSPDRLWSGEHQLRHVFGPLGLFGHYHF